MNSYLPEGSVTGLPVRSPSDSRLALSQVRRAIREIDQQIAAIRTEDRLFQRYHFGSDIHEIKLIALRAERGDLVARVAAYKRSSPHRLTTPADSANRRTSGQRRASWLLLPAVLGALVWGAIFPKRRRARLGSTAAGSIATIIH
jgi:hypothetical protein